MRKELLIAVRQTVSRGACRTGPDLPGFTDRAFGKLSGAGQLPGDAALKPAAVPPIIKKERSFVFVGIATNAQADAE
ncbi:hypothetical protein FN976_03110 [Caenimonas sedimenti]|uniref:Uncharacterized protein n=1 Tax=Caenimonas sedimenti TaxID=2596921 RepID=A0A562ZX94_9BURK|nr:hypothetical protein [Caenimonas sedimenti]TWO73240.1 hypothetical protein FN976_03110 [Caenimonas sedimenti]